MAALTICDRFRQRRPLPSGYGWRAVGAFFCPKDGQEIQVFETLAIDWQPMRKRFSNVE